MDPMVAVTTPIKDDPEERNGSPGTAQLAHLVT